MNDQTNNNENINLDDDDVTDVPIVQQIGETSDKSVEVSSNRASPAGLMREHEKLLEDEVNAQLHDN